MAKKRKAMKRRSPTGKKRKKCARCGAKIRQRKLGRAKKYCTGCRK